MEDGQRDRQKSADGACAEADMKSHFTVHSVFIYNSSKRNYHKNTGATVKWQFVMQELTFSHKTASMLKKTNRLFINWK